MNTKGFFLFMTIVFLLTFGKYQTAAAVTADELADIIESMGNSIRDISLEYEWHIVPPVTLEELHAMEEGKHSLIIKDGIMKHKLSAAKSLAGFDPNDPNQTLFNMWLSEKASILVNKYGNTSDSIVKESYNGRIAKRLEISGNPKKYHDGRISSQKPYLLYEATPIGFSVLRCSLMMVTKRKPLSAMLRLKEFVHLDSNIKQVNGFNTVRADLLQRNINKYVYLRIYFSVDHGYTPVRYEHMTGGDSEFNHVAIFVDVHSLEQVAEGLWFPSSGRIGSPDEERVNVFQTTSKIVVNQGLAEKDFDIEFPPGTEVRDDIKDRKYVVKSD